MQSYTSSWHLTGGALRAKRFFRYLPTGAILVRGRARLQVSLGFPLGHCQTPKRAWQRHEFSSGKTAIAKTSSYAIRFQKQIATRFEAPRLKGCQALNEEVSSLSFFWAERGLVLLRGSAGIASLADAQEIQLTYGQPGQIKSHRRGSSKGPKEWKCTPPTYRNAHSPLKNCWVAPGSRRGPHTLAFLVGGRGPRRLPPPPNHYP